MMPDPKTRVFETYPNQSRCSLCGCRQGPFQLEQRLVEPSNPAELSPAPAQGRQSRRIGPGASPYPFEGCIPHLKEKGALH